MFGRIARFYDLLNRLLSLGVDQYWRKVLARNVRLGQGGVVLDLAAGTLDVALAVRRRYPTALVPALDFCPPMLALGRRKLRDENARRILPVAADAKQLPLPDASVDCITMAFGIRNILPREAAFAEMLRVLRPGGTGLHPGVRFRPGTDLGRAVQFLSEPDPAARGPDVFQRPGGLRLPGGHHPCLSHSPETGGGNAARRIRPRLASQADLGHRLPACGGEGITNPGKRQVRNRQQSL